MQVYLRKQVRARLIRWNECWRGQGALPGDGNHLPYEVLSVEGSPGEGQASDVVAYWPVLI